jgi:hypothetical protein
MSNGIDLVMLFELLKVGLADLEVSLVAEEQEAEAMAPWVITRLAREVDLEAERAVVEMGAVAVVAMVVALVGM